MVAIRTNRLGEKEPNDDYYRSRFPSRVSRIASVNTGDEVRELIHACCPVACLGDAPFGYVNVFTSHVNVGFFHGASLPDPLHLLCGDGKFMRHVKLRPGAAVNTVALDRLIQAAYSDIKARVEHG